MKNCFVAIINGPNLNRLGIRDTRTYGPTPFEASLNEIEKQLPPGVRLQFAGSNSEGEIIDFIQKFDDNPDCIGIVINPGAYSHYSYAIADAVADCHIPVVEVHISNIFGREDFRHTSVTAVGAQALISGCGRRGYLYGVLELISLRDKNPSNDSPSRQH